MDLSRITVLQGDIADLEVDALVNGTNSDLIIGGGASNAIRRVGGDEIVQACNRIRSIPLGEAVVTSGGKLKAKHVIHAAAMVLGRWATEDAVRKSVRNAFLRAEERGVKTLALPPVGYDVGALPLDRCAKILLEVAAAHLAAGSKIEKIFFVLSDAKTLDAFKQQHASMS